MTRRQLNGKSIVPFNHPAKVNSGQLSFTHHHFAIDHGICGRRTGAQHEAAYSVVHGTTSKTQIAQIKQGQVGTQANAQLANVLTTQNFCATSRGQPERITRCHFHGRGIAAKNYFALRESISA